MAQRVPPISLRKGGGFQPSITPQELLRIRPRDHDASSLPRIANDRTQSAQVRWVAALMQRKLFGSDDSPVIVSESAVEAKARPATAVPGYPDDAPRGRTYKVWVNFEGSGLNPIKQEFPIVSGELKQAQRAAKIFLEELPERIATGKLSVD